MIPTTLAILMMSPPPDFGAWIYDGRQAHVNGTAVVAGEEVVYGWRLVTAPSWNSTATYMTIGVWLRDGTLIPGPGDACWSCAARSIDAMGTVEAVVYGRPQWQVGPEGGITDPVVMRDNTYTYIGDGSLNEARVVTINGFTDHVSPFDVTTTGATLPGQVGFGVPDGSVNLDDFGFYGNGWLEAGKEQ